MFFLTIWYGKGELYGTSDQYINNDNGSVVSGEYPGGIPDVISDPAGNGRSNWGDSAGRDSE